MLIAAIPDARKRRNRALTIVEVCVGVVALATLIGASDVPSESRPDPNGCTHLFQ
jgi:hypothetical protein